MKNTLKITLKANEKIYVNGAVIRTDRKVSLEFLNDVHFLLEGHVLQPDQATTPLRQLYFIVQMILMNPDGAPEAREMLRKSMPLLLACFSDEHILSTLKHIDRLVNEGHVYEALKAIRGLYVLEAEILNQAGAKQPTLLTAAE
ncbi:MULTISPECIES: flagellar biosynthesis repressor FlbT [unclassified Aminobacter]|uniref:flagellar biosynthesis repressor FlbT n=1 Tax=unclassified Aminobacter TaxID=2644704 RepID=UPI0004BC8668|nr:MULTISPECIES: flagellar biosynthesis repressor FlbT [unclassified Aminobacter]TWG49375.1 flagellar protein FlbT [Aminobacter sp. J44]TWH23424.1 flagellar protein FlbT [Aminobacter sp. J15]